MPNKPMKILVVGCGSIGRRHIRLLKEMGVEVWGCDPDFDACYRVNRELRVDCYREVDVAPREGDFDGAIIATPNHLHREPAEEALRVGAGVLIEKPICHTAEESWALDLLHRVRPHPLLVGYCLRFHPGLRNVKELLNRRAIGTVRHASIWCSSYLPDWRPGTDHRQGYAACRKTGGGVLLDCSHELDYACWLFGKPVSVMAQVQNTGALEIETEDVADVLLRFDSGVQANIHLDYLSRGPRRGCVIIGDTGTITWDFRSVGCQLNGVFQQPFDGGFGANGDPWELDDMYRAELRHFLACLRGEEKPQCTGEDGIRAVEIVEAARKSSETGCLVSI